MGEKYKYREEETRGIDSLLLERRRRLRTRFSPVILRRLLSLHNDRPRIRRSRRDGDDFRKSFPLDELRSPFPCHCIKDFQRVRSLLMLPSSCSCPPRDIDNRGDSTRSCIYGYIRQINEPPCLPEWDFRNAVHGRTQSIMDVRRCTDCRATIYGGISDPLAISSAVTYAVSLISLFPRCGKRDKTIPTGVRAQPFESPRELVFAT